MGVPLFKIIEKYAPRSIKKCSIDKYEGEKFMVDTANRVMQYTMPQFKNEKNITKKDGKLIVHLKALISIELNLLNNGISPIHVIDGKASSIKNNTLYERRKVRNKAKTILNKSDEYTLSKMERTKLLKKSYTLDKNDYDDIKKLLDLIGLPYIQATEEADAVCAAVNNNGSVYGVISQDMDLLVFGASTMLKDFSSSNKKKIKEINLKIMLEEMGFTKEQFVELCILLGTDYCPHIRCLKPFEIYDIYKQCGSIEKFLEFIENENKKKGRRGIKYKIHSDFVNKWKLAKEYYLHPKLNKDLISNVKFKWNEPDIDGLMKFLCDENDFNRRDTKRKLKKIMVMYQHYKSTGKIYSIYGDNWDREQQNKYYRKHKYKKYNRYNNHKHNYQYNNHKHNYQYNHQNNTQNNTQYKRYKRCNPLGEYNIRNIREKNDNDFKDLKWNVNTSLVNPRPNSRQREVNRVF
uniref:FLAP-like endonuclease XPG n=1 Tax=Mimivirus LCMiAC02 TaxID=2506609 RepID=A0A481Z3R1_9VIRU|nr:MAG: FLAP-like endonuclease XPG [Mimivirus LCMiAC02]